MKNVIFALTKKVLLNVLLIIYQYFFSDINFDKYPNEMNTLPKNLQQLVTEAMQTITIDSSNHSNPSTSTKACLSSTSDINI